MLRKKIFPTASTVNKPKSLNVYIAQGRFMRQSMHLPRLRQNCISLCVNNKAWAVAQLVYGNAFSQGCQFKRLIKATY